MTDDSKEIERISNIAIMNGLVARATYAEEQNTRLRNALNLSIHILESILEKDQTDKLEDSLDKIHKALRGEHE